MTELRRSLWIFLCTAMLLCCTPQYGSCSGQAKSISSPASITAHSGFGQAAYLFDENIHTRVCAPDHSWVTVSHSEGIGSLYLMFHLEYGPYTLTNEDTDETVALGANRFLQDFVDTGALFGYAPKALTLRFDNGEAALSELYIFSPGAVPDFVHKWEPPAEGNADLVLFSAHGDDEQLYLLGTVPYYAGELGRRVQVIYLTNHRTKHPARSHEILDGLYACGNRIYPVFGPFCDQYSVTLENAYLLLNSTGVNRDMLLGFVTEQLRRFRPSAAITHDVNGEYGHGQHRMLADLLMEAVQISMDAEKYTESANAYGTWDVPKTYLHLYPENPIIMDWDIPMKRFDGMTAYQAARDLGFPCHVSQYAAFSHYFQPDTAKEIPEYNPCYYGLYRSTVGPDTIGGDFLENIPGKATAECGAGLEQKQYKRAVSP